jgi:hypothetical protein
MIIRTKVFDIADERYDNLTELARAMGISVSQVYRVREGKRGINEKFIIGAKMAFPDLRLDEMFYFNTDQRSGDLVTKTANQRHNYSVKRTNGGNGNKGY